MKQTEFLPHKDLSVGSKIPVEHIIDEPWSFHPIRKSLHQSTVCYLFLKCKWLIGAFAHKVVQGLSPCFVRITAPKTIPPRVSR